MSNLCELCYLEDWGTIPCAKCDRWVCVWCSLVGLKADEAGRVITDEAPDCPYVLCSDCNPPNGGPRSRLRLPGPRPTFGLSFCPHRIESTVVQANLRLMESLP